MEHEERETPVIEVEDLTDRMVTFRVDQDDNGLKTLSTEDGSWRVTADDDSLAKWTLEYNEQGHSVNWLKGVALDLALNACVQAERAENYVLKVSQDMAH